MTYEILPGPQGNDRVVKIAGELDLYSSAGLYKSLKDLLDGGIQRIVLDTGELDYLDSSGVGVVIRLLQEASTRKVKVGVIGLGGSPKKVLQLCNVISILKVYETLDLAWTGLGVTPCS